MAKQKVDILLCGIEMVDTELIACTTIISQNYAIYFTGACYRFLSQVARFHGGSHMEAQKYKRRISQVSRGGGGRRGCRGYGFWMHGGRDGARRSGGYRRG